MVLKGVVQLLPLFLLMLLGIVLGKKGLVTADFLPPADRLLLSDPVPGLGGHLLRGNGTQR